MNKRLLCLISVLLILSVVGVNIKRMTVMAASDGNSKTVIMEKPPYKYYKSDKVKTKKINSLKLKINSCKPNKIIDNDKWFQDNKLSMNTYEVPNPYQNSAGNLPKGIDTKFNYMMITAAFYDDSYIYCTYGANFAEGYILNIYDAKTLEMVYSLDFSYYRYSPKYKQEDFDFIQQQINWAIIKDNILYVSQSHSTYAKSSNNMNGYITAIDLSDNEIIWRSKSLVSNADNFVIVDDVIICGYRFTDEPDYLYQIDRNTGKILDKTKLKTAATYIIKKGNILFVRTYNMNYQFKIKK